MCYNFASNFLHMIIHRMSTQAPEQPVRFYKGIALSFLFLTVILLGVVIYITSKKVTITVLTKQDQKPITFSARVGTESGDNAIGGKVYTSPFVYSEEFTPTGSSQVEDVATGKVVMHNTTGANVTLVKTTRLLSENEVLFRLSNQVVIPANGEIEADVYADKKGSASNIGPSKFTIPGLSPEKQKVIYAESSAPMTGGMKTIVSLGTDDIENAKNEYRQKIKQEFEKTLPEKEQGVERKIGVYEENILSDRSVGEVVSSFKIYGTSTLVVAEYKTQDLLKLANSETEKSINPKIERYQILSNAPKVSENIIYKPTESVAEMKVTQDIAEMMDSNSETLLPSNFFGKSKDEIERYVMALDHVAGVEVKFSPAWVSTAPAASDRVTVIVRDIK